jgi:hypothetical protein
LIIEAEPVLARRLKGDLDGLAKALLPLYERLDPRSVVGEAYGISASFALLVYDHGLVVALSDIDANKVHPFPPRDYYDR